MGLSSKRKGDAATSGTNNDVTPSKASKRARYNKNVPKPGEEGYKTKTQLRNARARRAKKKKKEQKKEQQESDPSSLYLSNPKSAPIVKRAWKRFQDREFPIIVGPTHGWRTVSKLAVRPSRDGKVSIGLFAPNTHNLVPVPKCVSHHTSINAAVAVVENLCHQKEVTPFDELDGTGLLRHVAINVERSSGKAQITLVWNANDSQDDLLDALCNAIIRQGGPTRRRGRRPNDDHATTFKLHSLWVHYNATWKHANAVFSVTGRWKHIFGPEAIQESLRLDGQTQPIPLRFPPNVFRQANLDAFANIVVAIREEIQKLSKERAKLSCVELYGGVGTVGLNVAEFFTSLVSSDENPFNKKCFEASSRGLPGACIVSYEPKNASDMVRAGALQESDVIIVDPPRKGLDKDVLAGICETDTAQLLVYVSCGFDAFERDCDALLRSGWRLDRAEGHLLFPGSDAIETLGFFKK